MSKVYISPSTQEHNEGAIPGYIEEKEMNKIADILCPILHAAGFEVYRNRPEWNLGQVVADSNAKHVDFHFAIHSNAGGQGKARGGEVFYHSSSEKGKRFAELVYKELSAITPTGDRGAKTYDALYELRKTSAPAALTELAFHDNVDDANWIVNNRQQIAEALARGIFAYFGISAKPQPQPQPAPKQKTWELYVQGEDARELQNALNAVGCRDKSEHSLEVDGELGDLSNEAMDKVWLKAPIKQVNPLLKAVQHRLLKLGYALPKYGADGKMSDTGETARAIEKFQADRGLKVDHIVGKITIKELYKK